MNDPIFDDDENDFSSAQPPKRRMTDLTLDEISGVDHPATLTEGWLVIKSADGTEQRVSYDEILAEAERLAKAHNRLLDAIDGAEYLEEAPEEVKSALDVLKSHLETEYERESTDKTDEVGRLLAAREDIDALLARMSPSHVHQPVHKEKHQLGEETMSIEGTLKDRSWKWISKRASDLQRNDYKLSTASAVSWVLQNDPDVESVYNNLYMSPFALRPYDEIAGSVRKSATEYDRDFVAALRLIS